VRRIYGYPGDGINSVTTTLRKAGGTEEGEADSHKETSESRSSRG
jgi:hypothetical protein